MRDPRSPADLRDFSAILSRTALTTPRRVFAATIALVILMGVATGLLARAYHDARHRAAQEQFHQGDAAAAAGRTDDALEHFRLALMLERDDAAYRRAVAVTLIGLRRTAEAETHLSQLLEHDPVDGEANLLLARISASRGAVADTEAFYQRAIYGRWAGEPAARRLAVRFELIAWLEQMSARTSARAELIRLQAEMPDVPFLQRELARRLLELDQPTQAAAVLQRELARRGNDASVAADLAKAEMAAGRLVEARNAARRALLLDPHDAGTRERLQQITRALSLDPTARGLDAAERFRRSQVLLRRVRDDLVACAGAPDASWPADQAAAVANAQLLLADEQSTGMAPPAPATAAASGVGAPAPAGVQNQTAAQAGATSDRTASIGARDRTDVRLTAAETLWAARVARCGSQDGAMAWIFDRLSR